MRFLIIPVFCGLASLGFAQTKTVIFTVIPATSTANSQYPKQIRAVLSANNDPEYINTLKIKFHPAPLKFVFGGEDGLLTWFSYTNPPKDKKRIFIEADQTSFGALLYRNTLYVCSPSRPQQSLPVINALLASAEASSLSEADAQSISLLIAKCSDALQVYGDPQSSSEPARKRMQKVASPPISTTVNGDIKVEFYAWSALPDNTISKWSLLFRANQLLSVDRVGISPSQ